MGEKVQFSIDKYELIDVSNSQLAKMRLYVCSDGGNSHGLPMTIDVIKDAAPTLLKKPIVYKYSPIIKDFLEHEIDEIPCGYISETENNLHYETIDNRNWLVVDAIIWKFYAQNVIEVFEKDNERAVSMEIEIIDKQPIGNGQFQVLKFVFASVTLLGRMYQPAIKGAKASIIQFAEMVEKTEKSLLNNITPEIISFLKVKLQQHNNDVSFDFSKRISLNKLKKLYKRVKFSNQNELSDRIDKFLNLLKDENSDYQYDDFDLLPEQHPRYQKSINNFSRKEDFMKTKFSVDDDKLGKSPAIDIKNSKDNAVNGDWSDPGAGLLNKLLEASNHSSLIKEAYLVIDKDSSENLSISDVHYPHHTIKDNALVVHIRGVQAALSRARSQGLTGKPISHIKKHYKDLGLNMENFAEFGLTKEDYDFLEKEGEEMTGFAKAVEKFGLNSSQIIDLLDIALSSYKYKNGDYEYRKYWVSAFDEEYAYIWDNEKEIRVRMKYNISGNVATVDVESAEEVISGNFIPVGTPNDNAEIESIRQQYAELQVQFKEMCDKYEEMCGKFTAIETEKVTMSAQLEEKSNAIQSLNNELEKFKTENEAYKFKELKVQTDALFEQYKEFISEEEKKTFSEKITQYSKYEDFEKDVFAMVVPRMNAKLATMQNNPVKDTNPIQFSFTPIINNDDDEVLSLTKKLEKTFGN